MFSNCFMSTTKILLPLLLLVLASSCSYKVMNNEVAKSDHSNTHNVEHVHNCSWAPLWLAPIKSDYTDVNKLVPTNSKILSVKQTVYPYVLFTKFCVDVKYTAVK